MFFNFKELILISISRPNNFINDKAKPILINTAESVFDPNWKPVVFFSNLIHLTSCLLLVFERYFIVIIYRNGFISKIINTVLAVNMENMFNYAWFNGRKSINI